MGCRYRMDVTAMGCRYRMDVTAVGCRYRMEIAAVGCRYRMDVTAVGCRWVKGFCTKALQALDRTRAKTQGCILHSCFPH